MSQAFSVSELTLLIKKNLESGFSSIAVEGEISNLKIHSSGHIYFSLKDRDAQLSAALFKQHRQRLERTLKDGDKVTLFGDISVYPPRGSYQILVKEVRFKGVGELLIQFHELKEKLRLKGYFDTEKKKRLPHLPRKIGVITSPTGAVIQDILHVLRRRFQGFHLILYPVKVQGPGAKEEIAQAIEEFNRYRAADLLIVGRGGGSLEDLWAFNEEIVANAIYNSSIPVISAVGHETDYTICDLVADVRAPTPSAAAEIALKEKLELIRFIERTKQGLEHGLRRHIRDNRAKLRSICSQPILATATRLLSPWMQGLDERRASLNLSISHKLERKKLELSSLIKEHRSKSPLQRVENLQLQLRHFRTRIDEAAEKKLSFCRQSFSSKELKEELLFSLKKSLQTKKESFSKLKDHLLSIDPKNLLQKGYTILFSEKSGEVILSCKDRKENEPIKALLSDGAIFATITKVEQ